MSSDTAVGPVTALRAESPLPMGEGVPEQAQTLVISAEGRSRDDPDPARREEAGFARQVLERLGAKIEQRSSETGTTYALAIPLETEREPPVIEDSPASSPEAH